MSQDSDPIRLGGALIKFPVAEAGQVAEHPAVGSRLKVVSDGTWEGTRVTANGKPVHGVTRVYWESPRAPGGLARVYLEVTGVPVELEGEGERIADRGAERP